MEQQQSTKKFIVAAHPTIHPSRKFNCYNYYYYLDMIRYFFVRNRCRVQILCKVDRGFFKADHQWTCYRRNYFQLTGAFTVLSPFGYHQRYYSPCISKETHFFIQHQDGSRSVITGFFLRLAARSVETDRPVKLIQLTPKRDKGPQLDPPLLPVDPLDAESTMLGACDTPSWFDTASRSMVATFERIQFKSATANNGKKRATQKHFVLVMELVARTGPDNAFVTIASCQSLPLVVRGRSPGHYADHSVVVVAAAAATKVKKSVKESSTTTITTENTPAAAAPITTTTSSVGQYNLFDGYPIPLPTCWSNAATSDSGAPTATTIYTSFSTTESMFGSHSRSQSATLPIIKQHEMDRFLAGVSPSSSSSCLSHNSGQDDPFNAAPYMSLKASLNDPFEVIIPQSRYFGYPAFSPGKNHWHTDI